MRLPKKIDHRLVDTIIQIQFLPGVPPETVVGYAHLLWRADIEEAPAIETPKVRIGPSDLLLETQPTLYFLANDRNFRVDVDRTTITFNSTGEYAGWDAYKALFEQLTRRLFEQRIIQRIQRLDVRYINRFDNRRLAEILDLDIRLGGLVPPDDNRQQLRVDFGRNGFLAVLTLLDNYPAQPPAEGFFSLFDVDIIKFFNESEPISFDELLTQLEAAHTTEKEVFFHLLKPDFLASLNPKY
jgi:uncharacterized protein (TIGR04255 family)